MTDDAKRPAALAELSKAGRELVLARFARDQAMLAESVARLYYAAFHLTRVCPYPG